MSEAAAGRAEQRRADRGRGEAAAAEGDRLRRPRRARAPAVIQGPKLLDAFGGSDEPAAAPAPATPARPAPEAEPRSGASALLAKATQRRSVRGADRSPNDDPQPAARLGAGRHARPVRSRAPRRPPQRARAGAQPRPPRRAAAAADRRRHAVLAERGRRSTAGSSSSPRCGRGAGRAYAERFATRRAADGLGTVSVLDSSTRKPLRAGYFVVYTGPFATLAAVQRSAAHVHAFGYRTAYVREILRY